MVQNEKAAPGGVLVYVELCCLFCYVPILHKTELAWENRDRTQKPEPDGVLVYVEWCYLFCYVPILHKTELAREKWCRTKK